MSSELTSDERAAIDVMFDDITDKLYEISDQDKRFDFAMHEVIRNRICSYCKIAKGIIWLKSVSYNLTEYYR